MDMQAFLRFFCDSAVSLVLTLYGCTIAEEYHGHTQPGASMDEAALDNCEQVFLWIGAIIWAHGCYAE